MRRSISLSVAASLCWAVGVAIAAPADVNAASAPGPMITGGQVRRICAELCISGLGGEPCGPNCLDILPQGLPLLQFDEKNGGDAAADATAAGHDNVTRRDACPVLCANRLGYPLCQCMRHFKSVTLATNSNNGFSIDFSQVCAFFCTRYKHRVYGCQPCDVYENKKEDVIDSGFFGISKTLSKEGAINNSVDWNAWCKQQCANGEGGAACNCDMLPMMMRDPFQDEDPPGPVDKPQTASSLDKN